MNLSEFHFIRAEYLFALIPLLIIIAFALKHKLKQGDWADVCDAELLPYILQQKPSQQNHWMLMSLSLAALLAIIALAGPTWERLESPVFRNDAALVIALNLSQTMDAQDIKPSRIVRARYKIADILRQRKDGLTALLVYSGDAFTVTPLTADVATIESQLSALETRIMPSTGNNTAAALTLAVALLQQGAQQQGDIFLITGGIDDQDPDDLLKFVGSYQLSVLGVGTEQGAPITLAHGGFLQDSSGNIVLPSLLNSQLNQLAKAGHGVYQQISGGDQDINALMAGLNNASTSDSKPQSSGLIEQWRDQGHWLLWLVLPLAALSFRKGFLSLALLLILPMPQTSYAVSWQDVWLNKDQQAQQAFEQQKFEQAAGLFQSPQWKAAAQYKAGQYQQAAETLNDINSADASYNKANALAKAGQLEAALKAYQQALTLNPSDEDAQHNLKQVEEALKQQKDQQESDKGTKPKDNKQSSSSDKSSESKDTEQKSDQQQPPQDQAPKSSEQEKSEEENEGASSPSEQSKDDEQQEESEQAAQTNSSDEQKQANEQWLNRIKDDPAGLLKRKFKYQYGQRNRQQ